MRISLLVAGIAGGLLTSCASMAPVANSERVRGWELPLGQGSVASYADVRADGTPIAIGVAWTASALDGLPAASNQHRCHGRDPTGAVGPDSRCQETVEHVIPLPDVVARRADVPFKWVLLNWNHMGHIPPGVYDVPHFDVHFEMVPITDIFAIEAGPCGPEFVRCDQFERGRKLPASNYLHADFKNVDAVVPAMGNHLIDLSGPEFNKQPFTRSFIYGVYDGRVTFYEEMVTRAHMLAKPNACSPIKSPAAVATAGYYPTVSCIRHDANTNEYTVSLESFVLRQASPALR